MVSAEKPALDPDTVKMWTLSAFDMNDDDVVSYGFCLSVSSSLRLIKLFGQFEGEEPIFSALQNTASHIVVMPCHLSSLYPDGSPSLQDLVDSDALLDEEDFKKPDPASLKAPICGDGAAKKKACKNW